MMPITRRDFSKGIAAFAIARPGALVDPPIARFFEILSDSQRAVHCFPFDHPLRKVVRNNWAVVKPTIGDLIEIQQELCLEIFRNACTEDGFERFQKVMQNDGGGFANYHVAVFGEPKQEHRCEWLLTGRHVTVRVNLREEVSGPSFYGHSVNHGAENSKNVWRAISEVANKLRSAAKNAAGLVDGSRSPEIEELLRQLISPFRTFSIQDRSRLKLAFHDENVWRLDGPGFSWHFHGSPHVHCWLEIDPTPGDEKDR